MAAGAIVGAEAGAALCSPSGPGALVCAVIGGAIGGIITYFGAKAVADAINNADEEADKTLSSDESEAEACSTCEPPPECKELSEKATQKRNEITKRFQELLDDRHQLYRNHYYKWQAHPDFGSWVGHLEQIDGWQRGLRNDLEKSRTLGCPPVSSDINRAATRQPPTKPGY